jgi:uncharacterized protein (TIGR02246 family)
MKPILLPIFLCLLAPLLSIAQSKETQEIEAIKKINERWLNTYTKRDSATLSKILANDFVLIAQNGLPQTRQDVLSGMLSPNMETISIKIDSANVRLLSADIAILNGWSSFQYKIDGNQMTSKTSYQDIYVKRKGRWVAVAAHVTGLNTP